MDVSQVNRLSISGGPNMKKTVWRICSKVFSSEVARQLNWCGRGDKRGIRKSNIGALLLVFILSLWTRKHAKNGSLYPTKVQCLLCLSGATTRLQHQGAPGNGRGEKFSPRRIKDPGPMDLQHQEHDYCSFPVPAAVDLSLDQTEDLRKEVEQLRKWVEELSVCQRFCLGRYASSDDDIRFYTRFVTYNHLMAFWRLIEPASHKGLTQRDLADRFDIHQSTAVKDYMPKDFQDYPDTQVLIDCTECGCQTPSYLLIQSEVFSSYKSHCTFKGLLAWHHMAQSPSSHPLLNKGFLWMGLCDMKVYRPALPVKMRNTCRLMRIYLYSVLASLPRLDFLSSRQQPLPNSPLTRSASLGTKQRLTSPPLSLSLSPSARLRLTCPLAVPADYSPAIVIADLLSSLNFALLSFRIKTLFGFICNWIPPVLIGGPPTMHVLDI
ncbi:hypothetical protein QQF64_023834 [Cirrhinus molitorella]|uniref:Transposase Helix-turn-helix domain-containing protein n=1 Tax=Cirrhinus molitorella TaxID=172907 RepID=A0ABR3NKE6_9TELE